MKTFIFTLFFSAILAFNTGAHARDSINARDAHSSVDANLQLEAISSSTQIIELNSPVNLVVQLVGRDGPVSNAFVTWRINQTIDFKNAQQAASFVVQDSPAVVATDGRGQSSIALNPGEIADKFSVNAIVSVSLPSEETVTLIQTFQISAGASASVKQRTPEKTLATTFDSICPELQKTGASLTEWEQRFLTRCEAVQKALSEGKTQEVALMLREVSPEEVSIQSAVGAGFTNQQIGNVASRLSAIRRDSVAVSVSQFSLNLGGFRFPSHLASSFLEDVFNINGKENGMAGSLLSNRLSFFANGNLSFGRREATSREEGFEYDGYGVTVGGDYRIKRSTFAGASLGLSKSEVGVSADGGSLNASALSIGVYGTHYLSDDFYIDGIVNLGNNRYDMSRKIAFDLNNDPVDRTANSRTKGAQNGLSVSAGYEGNKGAFSYTIYTRLNYTRTNIQAFSETGAQEFNISIKEQNLDSILSNVGAQLNFAQSTRWGVFLPFIWLNWDHEFSAGADEISGSFTGQDVKTDFTVIADQPDRNYFSFGQGVSAVFPRGLSAYIRVENILAKDYYRMTNVSFGGRFELTF